MDRLLSLGWEPKLHSATQMRRVRTLAATGTVLVIFGLIMMQRSIAWHIHLRSALLGVAVTLAASGLLTLYGYRKEASISWAANLMLTALLFGVTAGVLTNGGISSVNQAWLVFIPMLAAIAIGRRAAFIWGLIALALTLGLGLVELSGVHIADLTPEPFRKSQHLLVVLGLLFGVQVMLTSFLNQLAQSEAVLAQQNARLQRQITQTEQAIQEARAQEKAKNRFLANMSHELRTPLNAILGFSRRLDRGLQSRLDEREQFSLTSIINNSATLAQMVEDLFDLSALENGDLKLHPGPSELQPLFQTLHNSIQPYLEEGLALEVECPEGFHVLADQRRLQQVLSAVLRFSLRFPQSGRLVITARQAGQGMAEILVQDSAPPLGEQERARLFDRYNHLHSTQGRDTGVSGVAMALARELVELQGGSLTLSCSPQGNVFRIQLVAVSAH